MTEVNRALETVRTLLATEPLPGARERVHRAVLARHEARRPRRARPLVFAFAVALTTSAAAFALVEAPHLEKALGFFRNARAPAPSAPAHGERNAGAAKKHAAPVLSAAQPEMRPSGAASVNPAPELPHSPLSPAPERTAAAPAPAASSSLAEEVAAYREAEALVSESPGLAIVRLNAFRHRFPASALAEEASLRLIQALLALGREDEARRQARQFVVQYPRSAKRTELEAFANGGSDQ